MATWQYGPDLVDCVPLVFLPALLVTFYECSPVLAHFVAVVLKRTLLRTNLQAELNRTYVGHVSSSIGFSHCLTGFF